MVKNFQAVFVNCDAAMTVTLRGELDLVTAATADEVVAQILRDPHPDVILDLTDLTFLSAAGVVPLVQLVARLKEAGRQLTVRGATRLVGLVLSLTPIQMAPDPSADPPLVPADR